MCLIFYLDGNWGPWTEYSACSTTCGTGLQIKSRKCNDPAPSIGGLQCDGDFGDVKYCNITSCPNSGGNLSFSKIYQLLT